MRLGDVLHAFAFGVGGGGPTRYEGPAKFDELTVPGRTYVGTAETDAEVLAGDVAVLGMGETFYVLPADEAEEVGYALAEAGQAVRGRDPRDDEEPETVAVRDPFGDE